MFSAKEFGADEIAWISLEDQYGRLFVGGDKLQVFDGQSWRSFPIGNSYALRALALGEDGRLWAGATNEVGYFEEESLGAFKYHSLISHLPKEQQLVDDIWGCTQIGRTIYFICRAKLLLWDGVSFQVQPFNGKTRLFPIKMDEGYWFHHLETGLYRLAETGPKLEIPASLLPNAAILGMVRDKEGLLLASGTGLYRPGNPARRISNAELSKYITDCRLASFAPLPDGNYAIGTVSGGLVIASPAGVILRIFDTGDGLPNRAILSIRPDSNGYFWCTTPTGVFKFEGAGHTSVFNPLNGLKGKTTSLVRLPDSRLLALTHDGVFQLEGTKTDGGQFRQLPELTAAYNHLLPLTRGMLLSRHGGIDISDGSTVRPAFTF
ncbi:MAG: hypothetical protein HYV75_04435, partial [Opitutae bacterium]|nr:hypothetical protein [Opitutae bacterium]